MIAVDTQDLALVDDRDAVGQAEDLRQFGGDHDDGLAFVLFAEDRAVHMLDGAEIEATCRLVKDDDLTAAVDFAGQDDLLLVAAGQALGDRIGTGGLHIVGTDFFIGIGVELFAVDQGALDPGVLEARLQKHIFGQLHRHDQAVAVAVGGHVANPHRRCVRARPWR